MTTPPTDKPFFTAIDFEALARVYIASNETIADTAARIASIKVAPLLSELEELKASYQKAHSLWDKDCKLIQSLKSQNAIMREALYGLVSKIDSITSSKQWNGMWSFLKVHGWEWNIKDGDWSKEMGLAREALAKCEEMSKK